MNGDPYQLAAGRQVQHRLVFPHLVQRAVEHGKQLFLLDGLDKIVEGGDFIALGNVVGVAGEKKNLNRLVFPADHPGEADPVHASHFHVENQNIAAPVLLIAEKKRFRGGEGLHPDGDAGGFGPFPDQPLHIFPIAFLVVADGNVTACHEIPVSFLPGGRAPLCRRPVRSLSVLREGRRDGAQLPAGFEHKLYRGEGAAGLAAVIDGEDALGAVDHEAVAAAVNAGGIALGENMQL